MSHTSDFSSLPLQKDLLSNLRTLYYDQMTEIQAQSLPSILAGNDVIAQGKTGSGKTAAFSLGLLNKLDVKYFRVQALVLCPTRELADQVAKSIRTLARAIHNIKVLTLCGGMPFGPQVGSLEHGAHIIVGTPGRIEEHLRKGNVNLKDLQTFVLDEADRMLDMGFSTAIDAIISYAPAKKQTLLFSATFPDDIANIARRLMHEPLSIRVESTHNDSSIKQYIYCVRDHRERITAIRLLLLKNQPESAVVFCNTKKETQEVANKLQHYGFAAKALHGDLEQRDRDQTLIQFANKSLSVLVATDVAARGLDIIDLDAVINYQLARELEVHTHRIGRTGRAGKNGLACTLYVEKEAFKIDKLEAFSQQQLTRENLPSESLLDSPTYIATMSTLQISGGKKQKLRPGDILGALTSEGGIAGSDVGKISMGDNWAYVAVHHSVQKIALHKLNEGKLKGRTFKVRRL